MNKRMAVLVAAGAVLLAAGEMARGQWDFGGYEVDWEGVSAAGKGVFNALAPDEVKAEWEVADAETMKSQLQGILGAFQGESLAGLAAWEGTARGLVAAMGAVPGWEAWGEWLGNRLDFMEVASELQGARSQESGARSQESGVRSQESGVRSQGGTGGTAGGKTGGTAGVGAKPPTAGGTPTPPVAKVDENEAAVEAFMKKLPKAAPAKAGALAGPCKRIFREAGLPEELVWQAEVESSWNPSARSPAGAAGLYQFMAPSAEENGLKTSPVDQRLDALLCAGAAAKYLKKLHGRFGDWALALAAYNTGPGRVGKLLRETGGSGFGDIRGRLSAETKLYVPKIDALVRLREGKRLADLPGPR